MEAVMVQEVQGAAAAQQTEKRRFSGGAIATICGLALLVIFMIQNSDDVALKFLAWDFSLPIWLVILGSALLGAIVWFGAGVLRRHRRRVARRAARKEYGG
jgi:uncharacterized integral membrane protein